MLRGETLPQTPEKVSRFPLEEAPMQLLERTLNEFERLEQNFAHFEERFLVILA